MKLRLLASLLPAVLGVALVHAQDMGAPAAPAAAPAAPKAPKTALEKDMDKINRANRTLQRQVSDATKNDASLALLVTIHDAAVAAKDETPAFAADQADADRAKFMSDYKSKMDEFIASVDKVTADLKAGDNATAAVDAKKLPSEEKQDHKQFRKPEEKN